MAKNLKLNIKNAQIAQAIDLGSLKSKLSKAKSETEKTSEANVIQELTPSKQPEGQVPTKDELQSESPRIRARSKSAFAEPTIQTEPHARSSKDEEDSKILGITKKGTPKKIFSQDEYGNEEEKPAQAGVIEESPTDEVSSSRSKTSEELRKKFFGTELDSPEESTKPSLLKETAVPEKHAEPPPTPHPTPSPTLSKLPEVETSSKKESTTSHKLEKKPISFFKEKAPQNKEVTKPKRPKIPYLPPQSITGYDKSAIPPAPPKQEEIRRAPLEKLGPTGRHINDLLAKRPAPKAKNEEKESSQSKTTQDKSSSSTPRDDTKPKAKSSEPQAKAKEDTAEASSRKDSKFAKAKEFRDLKPTRKTDNQRHFDARDRQGLRSGEEEGKGNWRKKKLKTQQRQEDVVRPTSIKVRIPVTIKDLAAEMKLKASQLISKLFMQGVIVTLNDFLEDETTIQILGQEFGCDITIDTAEEERLRVTDKSIKEEIAESSSESIRLRPPIVAFMGHVDHGKTSLIDFIRKSNRAAGEAGAITQHIGAFKCHTAVGDIAILDTPGHEAFSAMRARGADVTDIVVLVVAGDEGLQQQTLEAIQHAKAAKVSIIVAVNKCDKPNFNPDQVFRQLSEQDLLPEVWGGQTITINCSAVTGEGVSSLLEMLALQAEVLELNANPNSRARGTVLESEMHKGMGSVATVLVQNGTLRLGDPLVFGQTWGRVKTMRDEFGKDLNEAAPSTPVEITGLSGLPDAGEEFIAVKNEREARDIAEGRMQGIRQSNFQLKKKLSLENLFQQASDGSPKKILNIVLRADVQGSLEALKVALLKIKSTKAELNVIFTGVGEISESDVQLAAASKAIIVGFHTQIESHAEGLVKEMGIQVYLHDIIYHAIDEIKSLLAGLLDRIAVETEKGKLEVKATFKSSQFGIIAGCQVSEGTVHRNHQIRVRRNNEIIWKGSISSLKRVKEDVREVTKGLECGVVLNGFSAYEVDDVLESYEISYITQEL